MQASLQSFKFGVEIYGTEFDLVKSGAPCHQRAEHQSNPNELLHCKHLSIIECITTLPERLQLNFHIGHAVFLGSKPTHLIWSALCGANEWKSCEFSLFQQINNHESFMTECLLSYMYKW